MNIHYTTAHERTELVLRESVQRLWAILETAVEGIITIDEGGLIDSLNPAACRIFGYETDELIGRSVSILMPPPDRDAHAEYIANYLRTGRAKVIGIGRDVFGQRKDGTVFPMELSIGEILLNDRRLFTGIIRDISERRGLEQAVAMAAEKERMRIARELHDGLGPQLGGLLFLMNGLYRDLLAANAPQKETACLLSQEIAAALEQVRSLAHDLYSVRPEPGGLFAALGDLVDRVASERGVECVFVSKDPVLVRNQTAANHLYRIAQEAVHNALKHSGATRIDIALVQQSSHVELSVHDNGIGFPILPTSLGLGLRTMEQRARQIGGRLKVHPHVSGGIEVLCSAPVAAMEIPATGIPGQFVGENKSISSAFSS